MRGKKTPIKKRLMVIKEKLKNPDLSTRELAKITGVNKETNRQIIKEDLPGILEKSGVLAKLIDDNNEILNITWDLLINKLKKWEKIKIEEILKSRDLAFKQNKLMEFVDKDKDFTIKFEI